MNYFFVTGAHKSGTSWLANMISRHPLVAMPKHELWLFGHPKSLGGPSLDKLVTEWLKLPTVSNQFAGDDRDALIASARRALLLSVLGQFVQADTKAVGEKTPLFTLRAVNEIRRSFPGAFIFTMLRDGRDVAVSHHFHNLRLRDFSLYRSVEEGEAAYEFHVRGNQTAPAPLLNEVLLKRVASYWAECAITAADLVQSYPSRALTIRYENLLEDPADNIKSIFGMLSLNSQDTLIDQIVTATSFETVTKGRPLGQADPTSFFRQGAIGEWKKYFSQKDAEIFNEVAGDVLISNGYALHSDWYAHESA